MSLWGLNGGLILGVILQYMYMYLSTWFLLLLAISCRVYRVKTASVDSQGQHSSIYMYVFSVLVCLFVFCVFELTRVDTCPEITYVYS